MIAFSRAKDHPVRELTEFIRVLARTLIQIYRQLQNF